LYETCSDLVVVCFATGVLLKMGKCNITLSFECDRSWEDLTITFGTRHRFCDGCQQNVYWVRDNQEAEQEARLGNCIAFINSNEIQYRKRTGPPSPPRRTAGNQRDIPPTPTLGIPPPPPPSLPKHLKRKFNLRILIAVLLVLGVLAVVMFMAFRTLHLDPINDALNF
jgi:hypothetical protein